MPYKDPQTRRQHRAANRDRINAAKRKAYRDNPEPAREAARKAYTPRPRKELPPKPECSFDGCDRLCTGRQDVCSSHYMQRWRGEELRPLKAWREDGARTLNIKTGYVHIKVDGKWRTEHRVVMEEKLGRPLAKGENVHHLNGDRADNRPENLELWVKHQPNGTRASDVQHCPSCTCATDSDTF